MRHETHRCDHKGCAAWATWGFRAAGHERWYCHEHRMIGKAWKDGAG